MQDSELGSPDQRESVEATLGADRGRAALAVLGFSVSLGAGQLALPLVALASGYDAAAIGILAAVSAVAQIAFRLRLPSLLRRHADRSLMVVACAMMVGAYGVLLVSVGMHAFVAAHVLVGSARALFWTSSQTHAVRAPGDAVGSLARVQFVGNIGTLSGPLLAGVLSGASLDLALLLGMVAGTLGIAFSWSTQELPPFARDPIASQRVSVWRRPGVDVGCWASFTAGGWRALLGSYFPVILASAGLGPSAIGAFMAVADGASSAAAALLARWAPADTRVVVLISTLMTMVAVVVLPVIAAEPLVVGLVMLTGGLGAGILMTLGAAIANNAVGANERGEAIAAAGTFRATALFLTPAAISAGLAVVSLPVSLAVAGVVIGLPTIISQRRSWQTSPEGVSQSGFVGTHSGRPE